MLEISWRGGAALFAAAFGFVACGGRTITSPAGDGGQAGATGGFGGATGGFGGATGGFGGATAGFGGATGGFGGATGGFGGAPACPPGLLQCGDLCVDAQVDPSNCGACGHFCNPGQLCSQGSCTTPCGPGATLCGNVCTNVLTDPANCGFCGNVCAPGQICAAATCVLSCGGGTVLCGNACVNLAKDPKNCGACGLQCGKNAECDAGICTVQCPVGTTLCGSGCVDLDLDPKNCGTCGNVCPQGQLCANGTCSASSCTNIAPLATGSTSPGGGSTPPYTAEQLNNGLNNAQCNQGWSWASSSGSPYFELAWPSAVTIGSIFVDAEKAAGNPACNVPSGRDIKSASVQYWNGSTWVTVATIQNQENYSVSFPTKVTTTKLRVAGVTTSPGNGNPIIYEWYVYSGTGCPAPPGV